MSNRYIPAGDVKIETSIDTDVFGDVEIAVLLMDIKQADSPILFEITTGGSVFSTPIIHKGVFYCGCCDHNFYALDAETGEELWRFATNGVITLDGVLEDDTIYFGSYDNNLYALNLDGTLKWKFRSSGSMGMPSFHKGVIYIGSQDGHLYALDGRTGKELWKFRTGAPVPGQPTIYKDTIYFGSWDHHMYALSLGGVLKWKYRCGNIVGGVSVYKDRLYFGSFDHYIYSTTLEGKLLWKYQLPVRMYSVSKPIISGGVIYVGLMNDYMYAIEAGGKLLWKFRAGHMIATDPGVHKDVVYFGSCDCSFYALDRKTGKELWKLTSSLPFASPPVFTEDRVYFGGGDCNFYCLDLEGKVIWKTPTSLSTPALVNMDNVDQGRTVEVVWEFPDTEEEEKYKGPELNISNYGEIGSEYAEVGKTSYMSSKKKGYV